METGLNDLLADPAEHFNQKIGLSFLAHAVRALYNNEFSASWHLIELKLEIRSQYRCIALSPFFQAF